MTISDFLKNSDNYVTREKMFIDRIRFDLKLAAAHTRIPLQIFAPDVDRDGYDIIIDDADYERRFQLKSVLATSATASWDIHKRLLRPTMNNARLFGFEVSPEGVGLEGGVILIKIDDRDPACPVTYYYTDVFVLAMLAERIIAGASGRAAQAQEVLNRLSRGIGRERVAVPFGVFLKVRSPSCLLSIGGFHSSEDSYCWWGNLITALRGGFRVNDPRTDVAARTIAAQAAHAADSLLSLVDEPDLRAFETPTKPA